MSATDQDGAARTRDIAPLGSRWPSSSRHMGLGVILPIAEGSAFGGTPHFTDILEMTRVAEAVGFDAVWIIDHLIFRLQPDNDFNMPSDQAERGLWECFTIMAGLASATERIQIGSLVACTGFRNPSLVAKMTETIDDISGGRVILGLGAGWHQPEYDAFGFPFDHRVGRFAEDVEITARLLRGERFSFEGRWRQMRDVVLLPPPERAVPILVAAKGPRMLHLTARWADAWNVAWFSGVDDRIRAQLAALDEACRAAERDPTTLRRARGLRLDDGEGAGRGRRSP